MLRRPLTINMRSPLPVLQPTSRHTRRQPSASATALLEARWIYDDVDKIGTLKQVLGVADTTNGSLGDPSLAYHRDYQYDSLLRPIKETTHVPAGPTWVERNFDVALAYD